ncbi:MAG: hypothetical protein L0H64_07175 [Pseudonocardia sp.]|nr:hypothetical protein [Pseudonocardia sp.]
MRAARVRLAPSRRRRVPGRSGPDIQVHGDGRTGRRLAATLTVPEGGQHDLVLEVSDTTLDGGAPDAAKLWAATETAWCEVMPALGRSIAPRDARHACAVLRGLTSSGPPWTGVPRWRAAVRHRIDPPRAAAGMRVAIATVVMSVIFTAAVMRRRRRR